MPENRDFSHLPLPFLYRGKPKLRGFNSPSERTNRNRNNRAHHGEYLKRRSSELSRFWKERRINRLEEDLPETVSYTHLDVYKRQILIITCCTMNIRYTITNMPKHRNTIFFCKIIGFLGPTCRLCNKSPV